MLTGMAALQYFVSVGVAPRHVVIPWTLFTLLIYTGFFGLIRSGWSERFADPAMTMAQMIYAIGCRALAYALSGLARGAAFPLVMVVLTFGMFALTPRQVMGVSIYAVSLFGAVMVLMSRRQSQIYQPAIEWGHFMMLLTMMPAASLLAGQLSRLRARLQRQKRDLAEAVERIRFLATRDDLTGLVNRRHVNELLEREQHRSVRNGARFCIALIDLDFFKRVNDTHGHGAGDAVLRAFADEGRRLVRATDVLGRWGGEEFILLMPDSALPMAREGTERVRQALERLRVPAGDAMLALTLSAGVVQHEPGESIPRMIERADATLYCAKSRGRNRVVAE